MIVSSSVKLRIIQGRNLIACDFGGKSDPYCKVYVGFGDRNDVKKTHVKKKTLHPHWDESFVFPVTNPSMETISIEVYDWDAIGKDDAMGGVKIPLLGLVQNVEKVGWYPLSSQGEIEVGITAVAFDSSGLTYQQHAEFISGAVLDPTQIPKIQPPLRWEVKDPEMFHPRHQHQHRSGWIQMFFDKPYYIGGETMFGRVTLNLNEPVPAKAVVIKYKGTEKTYIENTWVDSNDQVHHDIYKDHHIFYDQSIVLFSCPGQLQIIPPGMHTWNFSYALPPSLPSVFFEKYVEADGDKIKAAIAYKVKVFVDMPGSDIKAKEKLIISELVTQSVVPIAETKVKSFAFTSGKIKFTGEFGKNVYVPGEVIPLRVKVNNPTTKKVDAIKVKLRRQATFKAKHFTKENYREIARWKFPGVDKKSDKDVVLEIQLPEKVYPSSDGRLVKCAYYLDIELDLAWAFDMNIAPKVVIALLPAPGQPVWFIQDMSQHGGWGAW